MTVTEVDRPTRPRPAPAGRRRRTNRIAALCLGLVMAVTIGVLLWVLTYVMAEGLKYLGPEFLTNTPPGNPSEPGGGFLNGIIGSLIIVGIATLISVPLGIGAAISMVEYGGRVANAARFVTDVLVGIPTIVTGAFVYAFWVIHFGFSGIAGGIALALVMLPLVTRTTEEMLRLVPDPLREASLALGVTRSRTTWSIVLPTAASGIVTGVMLAIARAMGETAPLLLTALGNDLFIELNPDKRMSTLSLQIFGNAITGFQAAQARAWAGALTLVGLVLLFVIVARLLARRNRMSRS
ncbi:MAG: phosphate ABC transporter permease PstA [Streptosporangiales bacterium]|nr:phosphate ABC transporter permease PstA [Streptosporangiales bacterium]